MHFILLNRSFITFNSGISELGITLDGCQGEDQKSADSEELYRSRLCCTLLYVPPFYIPKIETDWLLSMYYVHSCFIFKSFLN